MVPEQRTGRGSAPVNQDVAAGPVTPREWTIYVARDGSGASRLGPVAGWEPVRVVEADHARRLEAAACEFLDAYVESERTIAANDIERLDEAETELRAALRGPVGGD